MANEGYTPVGLFPVSDYLNEELEARGWSKAMAASRLPGGRLEVDTLWLEFMCCREMWIVRDDVQFTDDDANRLDSRR